MEKDECGMNVIKIEIKSRFYKFLHYCFSLQSRLLIHAMNHKNIDIKSFDFIQSNVIFPSGIVSNKIAKKFNLKLIHLEHWSGTSNFLAKNIFRSKALEVLNNSYRIITVSSTLEVVLKKFINNTKFRIVPNVVNSYFKYLKKDTTSNFISFLAIANWSSPKNPFLFLDALEVIIKKKSNKF
jgi:hypothetical protein